MVQVVVLVLLNLAGVCGVMVISGTSIAVAMHAAVSIFCSAV